MSGFWLNDEQQAIRDAVARLCEGFDAAYWRRTDETGEFPEAFVAAMAEAGLLGLEVDHPDHSPDERAHLRGLAADHSGDEQTAHDVSAGVLVTVNRLFRA